MASAVNAVVPSTGSRVEVSSDRAGRSAAVEASRPSSDGVDQSAQSSL